MNGPGVYIRWKRGEPREGHVLPPLQPGHPLHDEPCPACMQPLGLENVSVQLLAIGPDSDEALSAHRAGGWYRARALLFHAPCLGTVSE